VVSALIAEQFTGVPLVMVVPQGCAVLSVDSVMLAVEPTGPKIGVSCGVPPAFTVPAVARKLVMAAGVTVTVCVSRDARPAPLTAVSV